ncbi:MAG: hypothetical protein CMH60_00650 [Myxococcales bacterium]|nr:hypothetical protein [Myxococcales bacterium]
MAISRIQGTSTQGAQNKEQLEAQQKRLQLNQISTFERSTQGPKSVTFSDGQTIALPTGSATEQKRLQEIYASLSPEKQEKLNSIERNLNSQIQNAVESGDSIENLTASGSALTQNFQQSFEAFVVTTGLKEQDEAVNSYLFMGIAGMEQNLNDFAGQVQQKQEIASDLRLDSTELQEILAEWPEGAETQEVTWHDVTVNDDGTVTVVEKTANLTKQEAENLLNEINDTRATLTNMNEMDRFTLQQDYEKYNQGFNILSAIIKSQHESLRSIANNMKA